MKETLNPSEVPEAGVQLEKEGYPMILAGPPSHGKTDAAIETTRQIAIQNYDIHEDVVDSRVRRPKRGEYFRSMFNATGMDPEDFAMPLFATRFKDDVYERSVTTALPGADATWLQGGMTYDDIVGTVIGEEIGKKPDNFKIWSELTNERSLGTGYLVPKHVNFIFTTNNAEDGAGAHSIHTDLISRACIIQVRNTVEAFLNYHKGELHPLIHTIIKYQGEQFLFTQQDEANGQPFCGPRTVKRASNMLNSGMDLSNPIAETILLGTMGIKGTVELLATWRAYERLGDIDEMLSNPVANKDKIDRLREDNSHNGRQTLCSLIAMLGKRVKKDPAQFNTLIKFVNRIDEEASVTFVNIALQANEDVRKEPEFVRHYSDNQEFYF